MLAPATTGSTAATQPQVKASRDPEQQFKRLPPIALDALQLAAIRRDVAERLRDPESARLKDIKAGRDDKSILVCGLVNAKNGFGGYTGFTPFIGMMLETPTRLRFAVISIASSEAATVAVIKMCSGHGLMA